MTRFLAIIASAFLIAAATGCQTTNTPGGESALKKKLHSIVIPKVEFEDSTISQVIVFLKTKSMELDPEHRGVDIVLHASKSFPQKEIASRTVTITMYNVPLGEAIRYICMSSGLKFKIDKSAVLIADKSASLEAMEMRSYPIPVQEIKHLTNGSLAPEVLRKMLEPMGVMFPDGSTICYDQATSKLIVYNEPTELRKIEFLFAPMDDDFK